jgi:hypothetical protein
VRHFCVQTDAERLRAGDGYRNVRFFGEAAECRRRHSEPERCASRQGAEGLHLSVCHYCHYLAALGRRQPRVSPGSEGTSNGRRHFDPSEIESSARSDGGRKVGHVACVHVQRERHVASVYRASRHVDAGSRDRTGTGSAESTAKIEYVVNKHIGVGCTYYFDLHQLGAEGITGVQQRKESDARDEGVGDYTGTGGLRRNRRQHRHSSCEADYSQHGSAELFHHFSHPLTEIYQQVIRSQIGGEFRWKPMFNLQLNLGWPDIRP